MKKIHIISIVYILLAIVTLITGCVKKTQDKETKAGGGPRKIIVGFTNFYPFAFIDDNGNFTGCDIEAAKLVDELLPDYEFEYVPLDQSSVFAGLQSGRVQMALTNSFYTEERAEKYLIPKENLGASTVGFITRTEHANVKNLEDAYDNGLRLVPILAGDGNYYIIQQWNKAHPDKAIKLTATDDTSNSLKYVLEGRYDFVMTPRYYYETLVESPQGSYHKYKDQLVHRVFSSTETWSILAKGEDEFEAKLSDAIAKLKAQGKLEELSIKFFGYNNWEFLKNK
jgi:L-cystine transport system substrate-binding protein